MNYTMALEMSTAVILAAFATGGSGMLAGALAYWSALRRQDRAVPKGEENASGSQPTDYWNERFQAIEDNARAISMHHDAIAREMQGRFENMVRGFNGKLTDVVVAVQRVSTILDERLPRR